jgi:hypothetical protein
MNFFEEEMTTNVGLPCYELSIMTEKDAVY